MAQKTTVQLVDDTDDSTEDVQTVVFYDVNGRPLEIDLSKENREILTELQEGFANAIAGFAESARKITEPTQRRRPQPAAYKPRAGRKDTAAIREWALANGHQIAPRGRIPLAIVDAYNAR